MHNPYVVAEHPKSTASKIATAVVALLILGGGLAAAAFLFVLKEPPQKSEKEILATAVVVEKVGAAPANVTVSAQGSVIAARQVVLMPQVGGRIIWQADELVPGGRFSEGDSIVRIDPRDYMVSVAQQNAQVASATLSLEQEKGRGLIAEKEWELLGKPKDEMPKSNAPLALREPQLEAARTGYDAAQAQLSQAQLNLSRTNLTAPFNAVVQNEMVDIGQLVGQQSTLATLVGTDTFWVQVSVPLEQLGWLAIPADANGEGSSATVRQNAGENPIVRSGRVIRLLGDLDPMGRMARVLVEIDDPLGAKLEQPGLPLLLGAFVHVELSGKEGSAEAVRIPRSAMRERNRIYLYDNEKLKIVDDAKVLWSDEDSLYVTGVEKGALAILSPVKGAVDGMDLRLAAPGKSDEEDDSDSESSENG